MASDATADAVEYFIEDMTYHGKSPRTCESYERVLREFEAFLADSGGSSDGAVSLRDATHRDCMAWIHSLRRSHAESTIATYAAYLHRFYAYMMQVGEFDANPMTLVLEEMDERIDTDPARREISLDAMRSFVAGIAHPLDRAVVTTLLKTGIRAGELCNLDLRDVAIDAASECADVTPRARLDGRGRALFVSPDPTAGESTNGETRTASNKRKRATVIPVDAELERELTQWLAVRPDARSAAEPLFVGTAQNWGARISAHVVHHVVQKHASERGWYRTGGGATENVTPHYFRHFFTTHLRDRTGDRGIVKYLRGDVADDVIDTYTHNWGDRVRKTYERHVYRLVD